MKYRKKPVVIEAITFNELVQYGIDAGVPLHDGMPWSFDYCTMQPPESEGQISKQLCHRVTHENDSCYLIPTLEGTMKFGRNDMLITGVKGEIYPCKREIFDATYEPVQ